MALTDVKLRSAKPKDRPYRLFDGQGGLYIEVQPNGSKLWRAKVRLHGKERRVALGKYLPDKSKGMTLAAAREACVAVRKQVATGIDPVIDRRQKRLAAADAAANTLRAVGTAWLDSVAVTKGWSEAYKTDVDGSLNRHVYPRLGDRPIGSITARDLLGLLNAKRTQLETVRRLRQKLDQIFAFAVVRGLADQNPAHNIRNEFPAPRVTPMPAVTEAELPALLAAVAADGNRVVEAAVWLLCLTACRTGELRAATWDEFDLEANLWTVPAERMKKRRTHVVPLSRQAVEILERLRRVTGDGRFVFPHRSDLARCMSENTVLFTLYRCGYRGRMTGHGFRSIFSTAANDAGKRPDVIEAALAHVQKDRTRAAYNRAEHLVARRDLLQWWADRVDAHTSQQSATVLTFPVGETA